MRWSVKFLALGAMLLASACSTSGPVTEGACAWVKPIYVSRDDVLTDETARQILTHNETWQVNCGGDG